MEKRFLFFIILFLFNNIFAEPYVREDEDYVTILDRKTFCGDCNFNLIRLYKQVAKPRFLKKEPAGLDYDELCLSEILSLQEEQNELKSGKKIIVGKENKGYFYKTFSQSVDQYLFDPIKILSTVRYPKEINTWSIPGEIIYFDEDSKPCEVEVGAFSYTIDEEGKCYSRFFIRHSRIRLITDKHDVLRCFTDKYKILDHTAVDEQIEEFLARMRLSNCGIFSKNWTKEIATILNAYAREFKSSFV